MWLIWREHPLDILHRLQIAGAGLLLAALAHILPMLANAWDWRMLIRGPRRPSFATMLKLVWIRESINGLLPVARIGGEIVSFGLLRQAGVRPATAVASLVADMQLTLISQLVFALVAIGYVLEHVSSDAARVAGNLAIGMAALVPVLLLFALVQHARPFERAMRVLNRVTSGKVVALVGESARTDQSIRMIWRKTGIVVRYLVIWQTLQFVGYALEIWLALYFLGAEPTFAQALAIEALIQLVSSIAFLMPGGRRAGGRVRADRRAARVRPADLSRTGRRPPRARPAVLSAGPAGMAVGGRFGEAATRDAKPAVAHRGIGPAALM